MHPEAPKKAKNFYFYLRQRINHSYFNFQSYSIICYFADKCHLENYGRFITYDDYQITRIGVFPMFFYQTAMMYHNKISRIPNMKLLSRSDIEVTDYILDIYYNYTNKELLKISERELLCYPAHWERGKILGPLEVAISTSDYENIVEWLKENLKE